MIAIIDYGMGNPTAIRNMLGRLGHRAEMTRTPGDAAKAGAERFILPGVGSFDEGMRRLGDSGWTEFFRSYATGEQRPLLGICLGMQLMFRASEEGQLPGLGLIAGDVIRFRFPETLSPLPRVPLMGWRAAKPLPAGNVLFEGLDEARFYFVHSYHCRCERPEERAAEAEYGISFTCAVRCGPLNGVQFHPEKSHRYGMKLLDNFAKLAGS